MKKILIISGHPDLNDSFANKTILEEIHKLLPEAELPTSTNSIPIFVLMYRKNRNVCSMPTSSYCNIRYSGILHLPCYTAG